MFGLQKQRRNAAGGGAWFIAGHLTVFAKLSHHAVPLESRIFSSRCFSFSVPPLPPSAVPHPFLPPSLQLLSWFRRLSLSSLLSRYLPPRVTIRPRRRRHPLAASRRISRLPAGACGRDASGGGRADFRISAMRAGDVDRILFRSCASILHGGEREYGLPILSL